MIGGGVPWWRVVNVHGTFPTTVQVGGVFEWERGGFLTIRRGKVLLRQCLVDQEWLDGVANRPGNMLAEL